MNSRLSSRGKQLPLQHLPARVERRVLPLPVVSVVAVVDEALVGLHLVQFLLQFHGVAEEVAQEVVELGGVVLEK